MVAINFSPQFADAVAAGKKTQTIRRHARAKPGQALQLYTGQRTKTCRKLADAICIDCTYVGLTDRGVTLGDTSRFPGDINDFARADGFENYAAMWKWFSERYETNSFTGHIIRWKLYPRRRPAGEAGADGLPGEAAGRRRQWSSVGGWAWISV